MATPINISEQEQQFLIELYKKTKGELSAKVSMQDVGVNLGLDKAGSSRLAEMLIGWGLVEVKTLAGGIGITSAGIEEIKKLGIVGTSDQKTGFRLGDAYVLDENSKRMLEQMITDFKTGTAKLGLDFEMMSEWMADLKTIDAQLTSSKPKTAIIRECFRSIKTILEKSGAMDLAAQVKSLLGE